MSQVGGVPGLDTLLNHHFGSGSAAPTPSGNQSLTTPSGNPSLPTPSGNQSLPAHEGQAVSQPQTGPSQSHNSLQAAASIGNGAAASGGHGTSVTAAGVTAGASAGAGGAPSGHPPLPRPAHRAPNSGQLQPSVLASPEILNKMLAGTPSSVSTAHASSHDVGEGSHHHPSNHSQQQMTGQHLLTQQQHQQQAPPGHCLATKSNATSLFNAVEMYRPGSGAGPSHMRGHNPPMDGLSAVMGHAVLLRGKGAHSGCCAFHWPSPPTSHPSDTMHALRPMCLAW